MGTHPGTGFALTRFETIAPDQQQGNDFFVDAWKRHQIALKPGHDIVYSTGIRDRPRFAENIRPEVLIARITEHLRRELEHQGQSVDRLIVATSMADYDDLPNLVAERTDLPTQVINAACANFAFALQRVLYGIPGNPDLRRDVLLNRHVLIVWLEMWRMVNLCNHKVAPLFGDACIAAGLTNERSTNREGLPVSRYRILDLDAERFAIDEPCIWMNRVVDGREVGTNPATGAAIDRPFISVSGQVSADCSIDMNGRAVFRLAPQKMVESAVTLLRRNDLEPGSVEHIFAHRANLRMRSPMAEALTAQGFRRLAGEGARPFREEDIIMDMEHGGNAGGASLPLALADRDDAFKSGDRIICTAVGGGKGLQNWGLPIENGERVGPGEGKGELTAGSVLLEVI